MSINIPDSLPKLFILIGIIGFAFGVFTDEKLGDKYSNRFDRYDKIQDSVKLNAYTVDLDREKLLQRSEELSESFNLDNPIIENDSVITFTRTFSGNKEAVILTDSLNKYWDNYVRKKARLKILRKKKEIELNNLEENEKIIDSKRDFYAGFIAFSIVLFFLGITGWTFDNDSNKDKPLKQQDKIYRFCQSCGYPFNSMRPYGTRKDKSNHNAFCQNCYKKGKFTEPNLTKEEFFKNMKDDMKKKGWVSRKILMMRFKSLERWNKNQYF